MALTAGEQRRLEKALASAFDWPTLRELVRNELGEELMSVVETIQAAEGQRRTTQLVLAAFAAAPDDPDLRAFLLEPAVLEVTRAAGAAGCTWEEIADVLWLAAASAHEAEPTARAASPEAAPEPAPPTGPPGPGQPPPETPGTAQAGATPARDAPPAAKVYAPSLPTLPPSARGGGVPLGVPGVRALPDPLQLSRSLRPLKQRTPSRVAREMDEAATVDRVASEGVWLPLMRPAWERRFDLALVTDATPSMAVWSKNLRELRLLLEHLGAFRDVRLWRLTTDAAPEAPLVLHAERRAPRTSRGSWPALTASGSSWWSATVSGGPGGTGGCATCWSRGDRSGRWRSCSHCRRRPGNKRAWAVRGSSRSGPPRAGSPIGRCAWNCSARR